MALYSGAARSLGGSVPCPRMGRSSGPLGGHDLLGGKRTPKVLSLPRTGKEAFAPPSPRETRGVFPVEPRSATTTPNGTPHSGERSTTERVSAVLGGLLLKGTPHLARGALSPPTLPIFSAKLSGRQSRALTGASAKGESSLARLRRRSGRLAAPGSRPACQKPHGSAERLRRRSCALLLKGGVVEHHDGASLRAFLGQGPNPSAIEEQLR